MRRELDGVRGGECGGKLEGAGRAFDHFVGGGEVVRLRYVRHRRPVEVSVWLGDGTAGIGIVLVFRLLIVVGGIGQVGLCLVRVVNCWVFSLIVVIDTTVERGICFIS